MASKKKSPAAPAAPANPFDEIRAALDGNVLDYLAYHARAKGETAESVRDQIRQARGKP